MAQNRKVLVIAIPSVGHTTEISDGESHHLTQVLRLRDSDLVELLDARGGWAMARLELRGKHVFARRIPESEIPPAFILPKMTAQVLPLTIEMGILKGEAMEWCVEKCVELGVRRLVPLVTERTVLKLDRKGPGPFQERWQKIADQALKQCHRLTRMEVTLPSQLADRVFQAELEKREARLYRLYADERTSQSGQTSLSHSTPVTLGQWAVTPPNTEVQVSIGPEGGWTEEEVQLLSTSGAPLTLGPLVLRAETAVLTVAATLSQCLPRS